MAVAAVTTATNAIQSVTVAIPICRLHDTLLCVTLRAAGLTDTAAKESATDVF